MDLLKEGESQKKVLRAYEESEEPKKVRKAVLEGTELTDLPSPQGYRYV